MPFSTQLQKLAFVALIAVKALAQPIDATDTSDLIAKLKIEDTRLEQYQDILTSPDDGSLLPGEALARASKFDFNTQYPVPGGESGTVATAYVNNFPLLLSSGISFSIASLGPCGVFFPHVHPRANELFTVIEGQVSFGYMLEGPVLPNDPSSPTPIPPITGNLTKFEGTLFPQGSIHWQLNDSEKCEPATTVATLSSEDPGTTAILQQVAATGGGETMRVKGKRQVEIGEIEQYVRSMDERVPSNLVGVQALEVDCKPTLTLLCV